MNNRLESLELQGLKTFATITRLEFPGKITAIVGPNGSGKSNIADAIRWVLGEQSFSLLRAKKTEDMIFSGSQQKSRAGMAAATITFNNEDSWLPIDYSHVAITRQAYRDGQNEYILNGQKVRLKDISELLAQTGMAERTYTIIGQGLVDVALALKPDERRRLFEEAAGIGLYRSRKEESLRRLESTRKNLDRVLDILTEIKPRLRSLERQAERYQEYQHLQSDLRLLLREWYGFHWHQRQQDLRNVRSAYEDQESRLHSLRKKYIEAEAKVEEARTQLQTYRKDLEINHGELSTNHRKLEQTTRELAIIEERQRSFEQQKANIEIDTTNLQEEISEMEARGIAQKSDADQRQQDYSAAVDEAQKTERRLAEISQEKERLDDQLNTARSARVALETEKVQLIVRIEEHGNRIKSLNEEQEKITHALDKLENESNETLSLSVSLENAYSDILKEHDDLQVKISDLSEQLDGILEEHQALDRQIILNGTQREKLATQLSLLKEAESALSGYSEGSKKLVEISRQGKLPKGIVPLSQHIVVEEKYERAVSTALGELTDLLVMPNQSRDVLIEYLESKESERVALVAFDQTRKQDQDNQLTEVDGVFGYANQLINVEEPYRKLVDNLFSDILIVRDAITARKIQDRLSSTQKVVTLSGVVFLPNGVIISGQSPSGRRIGRTRQQSEIQSELEKLDAEIATAVENQTTFRKTIDTTGVELDNLRQNLSPIELEKDTIEKKLQNTKDTQVRIKEQTTWYKDRLSALNENILTVQSLVDSGQVKLSDLEQQIAVLREDEQKLHSALDDLPVFELQQELHHWQTHHLIAKNALETAQQRFQDNLDQSETAKQRLLTYQTRFSELAEGLIEVEGVKAKLKNDLQAIQHIISEIETELVEPLSEASEKAEKSVTALQKLEAHSHQQVIIAERQYTQLQLELGRRQDQLAHLLERIEDDFGLVSFDGDQKNGTAEPLPFDDNLVEDLPQIQTIPESHEDDIKRLKNQLRRMGSINPEAQQEYIDVKERFEFLSSQVNDLEKASEDLQEVIATLDEMMETDFLKTFKAVNQEFSIYFSRLFNGGEAKLIFSDDDNPVEGGVDIEARLPGRRQQGLALLSGGERSLTAVALIFALLKVSPPPFCILDEVDAMLDESNVGRFVEELRELSKLIQVVIITHNRNTVQAADVIYGVTMGRDSTSQMISLKLEEIGEAYFA